MTGPAAPSWTDLEELIVVELRGAIPALAEASAGEPLAAVVLWADPYKGWYEVLADTVARNREGVRAWNDEVLASVPALADEPDAWKTAMSDARQTQARGFDPRFGDYAFGDDPVHTFEVSFDAFVRSPRYAELNQGGEDGWLEGHVRFVIAKALIRLVQEGAFAPIRTQGPLRVGYAYPDSGDAIIVAHVAP